MGKHSKPIKPTDKEVGYGRPPEHTKFRKGQPSPNPSGQRKRPLTEDERLIKFMEGKVPIKENGRLLLVSREDALDRADFNHGMRGNQKASADLKKRLAQARAKKTRVIQTRTVVREDISPEEAYANLRRMISGDAYSDDEIDLS